jgi:hypothetical protein
VSIPAALLLGLAARGSASASEPFESAALAADIRTYAEFGDHRPGTEADRKTAEWLAGRLRELGFRAELQEFATPQFFLDECAVEAEGR